MMPQRFFLLFVLLSQLITSTQAYLRPLPPSPRLNTQRSAPLSLFEDSSADLGVLLYDFQLTLSKTIESNLASPSIISVALLFVAGLFTALSPCAMSLVPLTVASLNSDNNSPQDRVANNIAYTLGLASVLSLLGLSAALLGSVVSERGGGLTEIPAFLAAMLSIVMGLNLLNIISLQFPSLDFLSSSKLQQLSLPRSTKAFLLGGSSALVASPCSSPVLTSLLAIVATSGNPSLGLLLLFSYSIGYAAPIVFAGSLSNTMVKMSANFDAANAVLASLLITYGTYSSLDIVSRSLYQ